MGLEPKAVLLMDNCSAHPDEEELKSSDGKVIAKFLPPNVTALIQPMDQGILVSIKWRCRRKILDELVHNNNSTSGLSIIGFLKKIDILKVINMIAPCWDDIQPVTLRHSWQKIFPEVQLESSNPDSETISEAHELGKDQSADPPVEEFRASFQSLGTDLQENEIAEWILADENDQGYEVMDTTRMMKL